LDLAWRKSAHSGENGCVEVAFVDDGRVAVRDSKDRRSPVLVFTPVEWQAFVGGVHDGEFDLPMDARRRAPAGPPDPSRPRRAVGAGVTGAPATTGDICTG